MAGIIRIEEIESRWKLESGFKYIFVFGSFGDVGAALPYANILLKCEQDAILLVSEQHRDLAWLFISDKTRYLVLDNSICQDIYNHMSQGTKSRLFRADLYCDCLEYNLIRSLNINHYDYISRLVHRNALSYFEALNTICGLAPEYCPDPTSLINPGCIHPKVASLIDNRRIGRRLAILNVHNQSNINAAPDFWAGLIEDLTRYFKVDCLVNHTMLSIADTQERIGYMLPEERLCCLTAHTIFESFQSADLVIGVAGGAMELAHCYTSTACMTLATPFHQWPEKQMKEGAMISQYRKDMQVHPLLLNRQRQQTSRSMSLFVYLEENVGYNAAIMRPKLRKVFPS